MRRRCGFRSQDVHTISYFPGRWLRWCGVDIHARSGMLVHGRRVECRVLLYTTTPLPLYLLACRKTCAAPSVLRLGFSRRSPSRKNRPTPGSYNSHTSAGGCYAARKIHKYPGCEARAGANKEGVVVCALWRNQTSDISPMSHLQYTHKSGEPRNIIIIIRAARRRMGGCAYVCVFAKSRHDDEGFTWRVKRCIVFGKWNINKRGSRIVNNI